MRQVKTPCVGVCSTVFGDQVCRGCKRFVHEIIDWNQYSHAQKSLVMARLENLSYQVINGKISVADWARFQKSLKMVEIDAGDETEPMLIFGFLRKSSKQIQDLADHGLRILGEYKEYSAFELKEIIDQEFFILSDAVYQSNFKRQYQHIPLQHVAETAKLYQDMNLDQVDDEKSLPMSQAVSI